MINSIVVRDAVIDEDAIVWYTLYNTPYQSTIAICGLMNIVSHACICQGLKQRVCAASDAIIPSSPEVDGMTDTNGNYSFNMIDNALKWSEGEGLRSVL